MSGLPAAWAVWAAANVLIAVAYAAIALIIGRAVARDRRIAGNRLAIATAGIFTTCAVSHGGHAYHVLFPSLAVNPRDAYAMRHLIGWDYALWSVFGALVALWYFSLRRSYAPLLAGGELFRDGERHRRHAEELNRRLLVDRATGLPNRAALAEHLAGLCPAGGVAVVCVGVERLDRVDATLGPDAADALLAAAATRVVETSPPGALVARTDGDTFAVVLEGTDAGAARLVGDALRDALRPPFSVDGRRRHLVGTVGVAADGDDVASLPRRAKAALAAARLAGTDRTAAYDAEAEARVAARIALEDDLRDAIPDGLHVVYQPIVAAGTMEIERFEALCRWRHPTRGEVPPDEFVPIAEAAELASALGRFVLGAATAQAAAWARGGARAGVAVNLSAREFAGAALVDDVVAALEAARLPAGRLTVEITETTLMGDLKRSAATLEALRGLGVAIALDDFGTGYSSLSYLTHLPIDHLKIDRRFVRDMGSADGLTVIRSVVALAHAIGLRVTAEGVETRADLETLLALGVDAVQGFLFARPLPPDEADVWAAGGTAAATR